MAEFAPWLFLLAIVAFPVRLRADDAVCTMRDGPMPARIRRTDPGGDGLVDGNLHRLPDLHAIRLGAFMPDDPRVSLFDGEWDEDGLFLRVDVVLKGLFNPPGLLDCDLGFFDPFAFGPHPVYGFVELDVDGELDTGGETARPELRFLGNAARFGGLPDAVDDDLLDRFARGGADFDDDCRTDPSVEFSGEEFHLALFGEEYRSHQESAGDGDGLFEAGESWDVEGAWLHRAHGFERFSLACGSDVGVYDPASTVRFAHDSTLNETMIALVFPLTNEGSRQWRGEEQVEDNNCDPFDQASIEEAIWDLTCSGCLARGSSRSCKEIIVDWCDEDACQSGQPEIELEPCGWTVSALLGSSYAQPEDACFVWTDVFPEPLPGDFTGDGKINDDDRDAWQAFLSAEDGGPRDGDGVVNGEVRLVEFALNFSLFDVNDDGVVSSGDLPRGDFDDDGDVDLSDWSVFAGCLAGPGASVEDVCQRADFDFDGDADAADAALFLEAFDGGGG